MRTIVVIPARLASTRLPRKPLADIAGVPMIVHVWRRAREARVGPVLVAAGEPEIAETVREAGGEAVLTDPNLPSGSDRVHAALRVRDPDRAFDAVINLQGDLPTIAPSLIAGLAATLARGNADIATLVAEIADENELSDSNIVKALVSWDADGRRGRALDFTRKATRSGYQHIGIYAYRRAALERFVALPASPRESRERLEQLRALDAGMSIAVALVDTVPVGVDTPADLEAVRRALAGHST